MKAIMIWKGSHLNRAKQIKLFVQLVMTHLILCEIDFKEDKKRIKDKKCVGNCMYVSSRDVLTLTFSVDVK